MPDQRFFEQSRGHPLTTLMGSSGPSTDGEISFIQAVFDRPRDIPVYRFDYWGIANLIRFLLVCQESAIMSTSQKTLVILEMIAIKNVCNRSGLGTIY